jgi:hypothetical protein
MRILLLLFLCGCPTESPYKDVTPQKVKKQVEAIQQQEEKRNDKRLEEIQKE